MDFNNLIREMYPLEHEYEADARDIWPARYNALLQVVEIFSKRFSPFEQEMILKEAFRRANKR